MSSQKPSNAPSTKMMKCVTSGCSAPGPQVFARTHTCATWVFLALLLSPALSLLPHFYSSPPVPSSFILFFCTSLIHDLPGLPPPSRPPPPFP